MGTSQLRRAVLLALVAGACSDMSAEEAVTIPDSGQIHRVLIRTPRPYDAIVRSIEEMGGRVTQRYRFVDAIAAEVPDRGLPELRAQLPAHAISKDVMRPLPGVARYDSPESAESAS